MEGQPRATGDGGSSFHEWLSNCKLSAVAQLSQPPLFMHAGWPLRMLLACALASTASGTYEPAEGCEVALDRYAGTVARGTCGRDDDPTCYLSQVVQLWTKLQALRGDKEIRSI